MSDPTSLRPSSASSLRPPPPPRPSSASSLRPPPPRPSSASSLRPPPLRPSSASSLRPPPLRPSSAASIQPPPPPRPRRMAANLTITALPEYPALSKSDKRSSFPVLIGIQAPPLSSSRTTTRAPLDLIAVLDVSGSMRGKSLKLLQSAVKFVVDRLGHSDRLSIITFNGSAQEVTPLQKMTVPEKLITKRKIDSLSAGGNTNIIAGLEKAAQLLGKTKNLASIIFLSDGKDNKIKTGNHFLEALKNLPSSLRANEVPLNAQQTEKKISVHTFGFGAKHDAIALHDIADKSGGTFSYIESTEVIQDAFALCIGGLLSVVARDVKLQLESGSAEVQIKSISSGGIRNFINTTGLDGEIYVGDVYAEEEKKFILYLSVPPADNETTQLLTVKCSYMDPLSEEPITCDIASVNIRRQQANYLSTEDRQVCHELDRERTRSLVVKEIIRAKNEAEQGNLGEARAILGELLSTSGSAQAGNASREVNQMQERMSSLLEYKEGGRAYMLSWMSVHMYQRASTQALIRSPGASSSAAPADEMNYQTTSMRRMLKDSQRLRLTAG